MIFARYRTYFALLGVAALCLVAASTSANTGASDADRIVIKSFMFMPMSLTIKRGSIVTWTNADDEPHTVVGDAGLFRSGAVDTNETFTFEFDQPGTYHYHCSIHPQMVGTIVVE